MYRTNSFWGAILLVALALGLPRCLPAQISFLGSESIANTTTTHSQQNPSSAVDSAGHILLVWESYQQDGDDYGIFAAAFNADGTPLLAEFQVNSTTANGQRYPSVAISNAGEFVVTWMSEAQDGDGWGVYARRFTISGTALSGEVLVNADSTAGDQKFPHVAMNGNGEYMITWMSNSTGNFDVIAKQYDNAGSAIAGEYTVNSYTTDYQGYPRAALRADGYGMVVWQSKDQDGSGNGIYGQRVSPSATLVGSEFGVNTYTSGNQQEPDIAMNSQGETVIVWSSYGQDGDREGIYVRKYDSSGTASTAPFKANTYTSGVQSHPVCSIMDSSEYVIAWNSYGEDGSFDGVYMQAYSANDAAYGTQTQVNTRTTDFQQFPDVSLNPTGYTLVAVWQDGLRNDTATHDGDDYGIYFNRLSMADTTPPTAICQNLTIFVNSAGNATVSANDIDGGSSDNSGTVYLSASPTSFNCNDLGLQTVTLTVSDAAGNSSTCTSGVTVVDSVSPIAICQSISVYLDGAGNSTITANDIDNGSSDNCSTVSTSISTSSFTCNEIGANTVTLTATDGSGNTANCTSTVTIIDSISPTAVCQNISVFLDGVGNATITANDIDNGSTDNCSSVTLNATPTAFTCSNVGSNTATLTATDGSGNTHSCTSTITVVDSVTPTAVCQNITVFLNSFGNATVTSADVDAGSTDNCSPLTLSPATTTYTCNELGSNAFTLTATDPSGNSASCSSVVTVVDTVAPTAICNNALIQLDSTGNAVMGASVIGASSTDNCGLMSATLSQSTFNCGDIGMVSITFTVTDSSGNASSCTAAVTVEDITPPLVVCSSTTIQLDSSGNAVLGASVIGLGTADACTTFTSALSLSNFTCNEIGANTVVFTATDAFGNADSCSATVTVTDNIAPIAACANPVLYLDGSGNATLTTTLLDGGTADNCTLAGLSLSASSFDCNDLGTQTVTLTAVDGEGNSSSCTGTVTLLDSIAPTASCQNIIIYLDGSGQATLSPNDVDGGSTDNCAGANLLVTPANFDCNTLGNQTVTLTVADSSGNSSTCTAVVTVADSTAPTTVCQPITVYLDSLGTANITANDIDGGTMDNCTLSGISASPTSFSCIDVGMLSVTLFATDVNGNSATCTSLVAVVDTIAPTTLCQNISLYLDGTGNATLNPLALDNGSTDACFLTLTASASGFGCGDIGAQAVTLTATDLNGNASTCTSTVTVMDSIAPTVVCNAVDVYLDGSGQASITPAHVGAGTTDNCGFTEAIDLTSFSCLNLGTQTVTYTATDSSGNVANCSASITVIDSMAPMVVCQNDTVYLDSTGNGSTTLNQLMVSQNDNCGIASTSASQLSFTATDIGVNSVTVSAVDSSGNIGSCLANVTVIDTFATAIDPGLLGADGLIWQAWPNPARDEIRVEIACGNCLANGEYQLELTDMSGRVLVQRTIVLNGNSIQVTLDLRNYASGVMALTLKNGKGQQTRRVVKL